MPDTPTSTEAPATGLDAAASLLAAAMAEEREPNPAPPIVPGGSELVVAPPPAGTPPVEAPPRPGTVWGAIAKQREGKRTIPAAAKPTAPQQGFDPAAVERLYEQRIVDEFERDPVGFYERRPHLDPSTGLRRFTEHAIDRKKASEGEKLAQLETKLEKWEREQREAQEAAAQHAQLAEQQRQHEEAKAAFTEMTADAKAYPQLSRLGDEQRALFGVMFARTLADEGVFLDEAGIAGIIEDTFSDLRKAWAAEEQATQVTGKTPPRRTTVAAAEAAQVAAPKVLVDMDDKMAAAADILRRDWAAAD